MKQRRTSLAIKLTGDPSKWTANLTVNKGSKRGSIHSLGNPTKVEQSDRHLGLTFKITDVTEASTLAIHDEKGNRVSTIKFRQRLVPGEQITLTTNLAR